MICLGLDLSITGSGAVVMDSRHVVLSAMLVNTTPECGNDMLRFNLITACLRELVVRWEPDLAVIENYAYDKPQGVARMAELGGQVKGMLWRTHVDYICIPPSSLKLYFTGNGRADKPEMIEVAQQWIEGLDQPDIADATACAAWGLEHGQEFPA